MSKVQDNEVLGSATLGPAFSVASSSLSQLSTAMPCIHEVRQAVPRNAFTICVLEETPTNALTFTVQYIYKLYSFADKEEGSVGFGSAEKSCGTLENSVCKAFLHIPLSFCLLTNHMCVMDHTRSSSQTEEAFLSAGMYPLRSELFLLSVHM
jgi:hypothetical protein